METVALQKSPSNITEYPLLLGVGIKKIFLCHSVCKANVAKEE